MNLKGRAISPRDLVTWGPIPWAPSFGTPSTCLGSPLGFRSPSCKGNSPENLDLHSLKLMAGTPKIGSL